METNETTGLDTSNPSTSEGSGNKIYTVKVDGEEQKVSLDELQNGYQRQADYTRKTQELGRERERLAQGEAIVQALESDPQGAITALGDAFGIGMGNGNVGTEDPYEELDPEETRLRRMESSIEEQNKALRQQNLQKELNGLRDKYGTDIDENALFSHALKNDIGNLDAAFTHMNYGSMADQARNSEIVDEKRAANVVSPTGGTTSGSVDRAAGAITSVRDAYMAAIKQP
jgi:hypothetical protein